MRELGDGSEGLVRSTAPSARGAAATLLTRGERAPAPAGVIALQRQVGNRAVARLLQRSPRRVWAEAATAHGIVCEDASNTSGRGQSGWEAGVNFATIDELLRALDAQHVGFHSLDRLAITAHGLNGSIDFESGQPPLTTEQLRAVVDGRAGSSSDPYYAALVDRLTRVGQRVQGGGTVLLAGCLSGGDDRGAELLHLLAEHVFHCRVVGFSTVTAEYNQGRPGSTMNVQSATCSEPGTHVTNETSPPAQDSHRDYSGQNLPWASETAPHAVIATPGAGVSDSDVNAAAPPPVDPAAAVRDHPSRPLTAVQLAAMERQWRLADSDFSGVTVSHGWGGQAPISGLGLRAIPLTIEFLVMPLDIIPPRRVAASAGPNNPAQLRIRNDGLSEATISVLPPGGGTPVLSETVPRAGSATVDLTGLPSGHYRVTARRVRSTGAQFEDTPSERHATLVVRAPTRHRSARGRS
jgi:hypothetical protein